MIKFSIKTIYQEPLDKTLHLITFLSSGFSMLLSYGHKNDAASESCYTKPDLYKWREVKGVMAKWQNLGEPDA